MGPEPRKLFQKLTPYVPGEQPQEGGFIKLNTNENPYPPGPSVAKRVSEAVSNRLRIYPDPVCSKLRAALSARVGFPPEQILVANGSDESLRLLCTAFLEPGETIAMLSPTYSLYETLAQIADAKWAEFPVSAADDYAFPSNAIKEKAAKIFFLANPNPPLGTFYDRETVRALCEARANRLVVLDEAYVDFSRGNHLSLVREFPNLAVTRTYSKAYSLAGARVGYVVAQRAVIERLYAVKDSYNVNALSQAAAIGALEDKDYYSEKIAELIATRDELRAELGALGFEVPESQGNFLFARRGDGASLYEMLKKEKILVRHFKRANLKDGVRITIGTRQQVATLLETLKNLVEKVPALRQV